MAGFDGRIGEVGSGYSTTSVDPWWKKDDKPKDSVGCAYMACQNIGNYLNGTKPIEYT